jgi:hypothetical protein
MAHLVHNERAKLIANAFDRASTGCFAAGILAPIAGTMFGQSVVASWEVFLASTVFWSFAAGILHIEAQRMIACLRE